MNPREEQSLPVPPRLPLLGVDPHAREGPDHRRVPRHPPANQRAALETIRRHVHATVPNLEECIDYGVPPSAGRQHVQSHLATGCLWARTHVEVARHRRVSGLCLALKYSAVLCYSEGRFEIVYLGPYPRFGVSIPCPLLLIPKSAHYHTAQEGKSPDPRCRIQGKGLMISLEALTRGALRAQYVIRARSSCFQAMFMLLPIDARLGSTSQEFI